MDTTKRIEQLRKQLAGGDDESIKRVSEWEKEVKKLMLKQNFGDNTAVKEFQLGLMGMMLNIDDVLKSDDEMNSKQRNRLIDKRRVFKWVLEFFTDAKAQLKQLEKEIKDTEITNPNDYEQDEQG